ncbi:phosphopantetheine-binding protein [Streptomyces sp. M19]
MTGTLSDVDLERMAGSGMLPLSVEQGLELFDRALLADQAVVGLTRLDQAVLRSQGDLPPLMRSLVKGSVVRRIADDRQKDADTFTDRWAALPAEERDRLLLDLVRGHAAAVLGHTSAHDIDSGQAFKQLGFDSLTAVELRNRLASATGLRLPATLVFDYPTIAELVGLLTGLLGDALPGPEAAAGAQPTAGSVLSGLEQLSDQLTAVQAAGEDRQAITNRLRSLLTQWTRNDGPETGEPSDDHWETPDDVYQFIENELGISGSGSE